MPIVGDLITGQPVTFKRLRQLMADQGGGLQEGVIGASDFKVAQRGAGANMSVDVAAGSAWVQVDTGSLNGLSHAVNDATANATVTSSNATNPRVDMVVLRYNDSAIPTGSGDTPTLVVLAGTPTAGATLDNRSGAVALPNDCLLLADVLVPALSTSVVTANVRDRRKWARGAFVTQRFAGASNATASSTMVALGGILTNRVECSGAPLLITFSANLSNNTAGAFAALGLQMDGAQIDATADILAAQSATAGQQIPASFTYPATPAAGSHLFAPSFRAAGGGTATVVSSTGSPALLAIVEQVRQNTPNLP